MYLDLALLSFGVLFRWYLLLACCPMRLNAWIWPTVLGASGGSEKASKLDKATNV